MITSIRKARVDFKTGIFILVLAAIMWGVFAYVRVRDFVPEEFTEPVETPVRTP